MEQPQQTGKLSVWGQVYQYRRVVGVAAITCMITAGGTSLRAADKAKPAIRTARRTSDVKVTADHKLAKPLELARQCRKSLEDVQDYTSTFSKRERVGRGGKKLIVQSMAIKFREKPFSVYFLFQDKNTRGREVIYVAGQNQGNLLVHEAGFASIAGTLKFAPNASDVMEENRYPITQFGLKNLVEKVIAQWEAESKYDETDVKYYNQAHLGDTECLAIETSHPQPRRQFKYHKTLVYIDKKTKLLVRVEQYGWPTRRGEKPPIIEEYTYSNIKTNVGLKNIDFHPNNPNYNY